MAPRVVDTQGAFCPVPVMELAKAMRELPPGSEILLLATDPAAEADLQAWCASTGNTLLGVEHQGPTFRARVRKAAQP